MQWISHSGGAQLLQEEPFCKAHSNSPQSLIVGGVGPGAGSLLPIGMEMEKEEKGRGGAI